MFNMQNILQSLKSGIKISDEYGFLKKYDKNSNSIFDENEIGDLSEVLKKQAELDGDASELSEEELISFFDNSFEKNNSNAAIFDIDKSGLVSGWLNEITGENQKILQKYETAAEKKNITSAEKEYVQAVVQNKLMNGSEYHIEYTDEEDILNEIDELISNMKELEDARGSFENNSSAVLDAVKKLSKIPNFDLDEITAYDIQRLNNLDKKTLDENIKKVLNSNIYTRFSINGEQDTENVIKLLSLDETSLEQAEKLLNFPLPLSSICNLAVYPKSAERLPEIINLSKKCPVFRSEKFAAKLAGITDEQFEKFKKDINNFTSSNPNYVHVNDNSSDEFIVLKTSADDTKEHVFNVYDGYTETREIKHDTQNNQTEITINNHHLNSKAVLKFHSSDMSELEPAEGKREFYGSKGALIKTETTALSGLQGLPNISYTNADNQTFPVQFASIDENDGRRFTEKHFVSPAGTKTDYTYEQAPDGSRISDCKITDKNGNVLLSKKYTLQKINENKFISKINDKTYETEFNGTEISITDKSTGKTEKFDIGGKIKIKEDSIFNTDKKTEINSEKVSEDIMNMLKTLPADQLLLLNRLPFNGINYNPNIENNACWNPEEMVFEIGKFDNPNAGAEFMQNLFMHEYGHFMDVSNTGRKGAYSAEISGSEDFMKIYKKEYEEFMHNTDSIQQYEMHHLFENLSEIAAEANMLIYAQEPACGGRAALLQQYFSETIAKAAELFDKKIEKKMQ